MIEYIVSSPDEATFLLAASEMGLSDGSRIIRQGSLSVGSWFFNYVGEVRQPTGGTIQTEFGPQPEMAAIPGVWARIRVNGDREELPTLTGNSGLTVYYSHPEFGWSADGVTPAPAYVANIGVIL